MGSHINQADLNSNRLNFFKDCFRQQRGLCLTDKDINSVFLHPTAASHLNFYNYLAGKKKN